MKPEVRNLYLYHTRNTFISMIFFSFFKQTNRTLLSVESHNSIFPNLWNMADVIYS